jgi:hypothetical protein
MAKAAKDDYKKIVSGMVDVIEEHLDTFPAEERKRRIKAVAAYVVGSRRPPSKIRSQETGTAHSQPACKAQK